MCRYLAAYIGGTKHQLTVLDVGAHEPQVLCQVQVHAPQLQPEPWQLNNCMQLQAVRPVS